MSPPQPHGRRLDPRPLELGQRDLQARPGLHGASDQTPEADILTPFIVTLGAWGALRGLAKGLANETVVSAPQTWLNSLLAPPPARWALFPIGVWLTILLGGLVAAALRYTRFGRHVFVIGSNEATARLYGVAVEARKVLVYVLGLGLVGLAGVLQFSYLSMGEPTAANGYELNAIAAAFIGGASLSGGRVRSWAAFSGRPL